MKLSPLEQASNPVRIKLPHNKVRALNGKAEKGEGMYSNISSKEKIKIKEQIKWGEGGTKRR